MLQKLTWRSFLFTFFLIITPLTLLGWLFGYPFLGMAIGLFILLIWNYYQLLKLSHWLWQDNSIIPPTAKGHWEVIFYGLLQLQKRNRKRRNELATLIKRFRSGAESLPDALVMITPEGTIFWCNRLAEDLLGFKWPGDNGQNIINLLRYPELARYLKNKVFTDPLTLTLYSEKEVEFRIMPYIDEAFIVLARDVTQLKQAEIARRNFFNNASHELGTPLTVLKGYLDIINDDALDEHLPKNALQTMRLQIQRMETLIGQLLALSRLEYQVNEAQKIDVPISSLLITIMHSAEALNSGKHQFSVSIEPDLFVIGYGDELRSAMSNLIENAIKHTPSEANIEVKLFKLTPATIKFEVIDSGQGIASEHIPHLTERFYRVDGSRNSHSGGSGIGLAIVKHVLSRHHSKLEIKSTLGQGASFSFILQTAHHAERSPSKLL